MDELIFSIRFWIIIPLLLATMLSITAYFWIISVRDSSYETTGIVVGKTIKGESNLLGGYSYDVCIVNFSNKTMATEGNGCLYNNGDKVNLFVSKMGITIMGKVQP